MLTNYQFPMYASAEKKLPRRILNNHFMSYFMRKHKRHVRWKKSKYLEFYWYFITVCGTFIGVSTSLIPVRFQSIKEVSDAKQIIPSKYTLLFLYNTIETRYVLRIPFNVKAIFKYVKRSLKIIFELKFYLYWFIVCFFLSCVQFHLFILEWINGYVTGAIMWKIDS